MYETFVGLAGQTQCRSAEQTNQQFVLEVAQQQDGRFEGFGGEDTTGRDTVVFRYFKCFLISSTGRSYFW